jgi:ankyrin repeat protein
VKLLLAHGALPDLPNQLGITPLMAAAGIGSTTIDIRGRFRDEKKCIEAGRLILAAGADINAARDNGQTATHGAATWGWNGFVRFLPTAAPTSTPGTAAASRRSTSRQAR